MLSDHAGAGVRLGLECTGHAMVYFSELNRQAAACAHARW